MTLVELLVASAVMSIVLLAVASSFITAQRMMRTAMAESELSLAAREIREKLLFRMTPTINGVHYAGLLSGTNSGQIVESSGIVLLRSSALGSSLSDIRDQSMRLMVWSEPCRDDFGALVTRYYLINEHTPNKDAHRKWLWPTAVSLADISQNEVVSCDRVAGAQPFMGVYRLKLGVNLQANVRNLDGSPIIRRERVNVPIFGKIQPFVGADGGY